MKFAKESLNLMDSENYYSWFDRILAVIFFLSPLALFYWAYLKCDHENSRVLCEAHEDYLFICLDCGKEFWGERGDDT